MTCTAGVDVGSTTGVTRPSLTSNRAPATAHGSGRPGHQTSRSTSLRVGIDDGEKIAKYGLVHSILWMQPEGPGQ